MAEFINHYQVDIVDEYHVAVRCPLHSSRSDQHIRSKDKTKASSTYLSDEVFQYVKRFLILLRSQRKVEKRLAETRTLGVAGIDKISMFGSQS